MEQTKKLELIRTTINEDCKDYVSAYYAGKNDWLLIKTADRNKGIGAIRVNKNSFITFYLDTKKDYDLSAVLEEINFTHQNVMFDLSSKESGNFIKNKIKLYDEQDLNFVIAILKKVFKDGGAQTERRIRYQENSVVA